MDLNTTLHSFQFHLKSRMTRSKEDYGQDGWMDRRDREGKRLDGDRWGMVAFQEVLRVVLFLIPPSTATAFT